MVLFKGQIKYSELKSCSLWTQMPAFSLSSKLARYAAEWKSEKQFLLQHIRLSKYSHHARIRPPYFSGFRIAAVLWQGTGEEKGALLRAGCGARAWRKKSTEKGETQRKQEKHRTGCHQFPVTTEALGCQGPDGRGDRGLQGGAEKATL